jgi:hypothetical protein
VLNAMQLEMAGEAGGGRGDFADPRGRAWTEDDGMAVKQQRSVLDEHSVGVVGKLGQADDLEAGVGNRLLIGGVLRRGTLGRDGPSLKVRQLAFGEPWTDRAGEGSTHQRGGCDSLATILISVMPVSGISRATSIAVQAGGGPTTYLFFTATIAGICVVRSVWKLVMSTTSSQLLPLRLRIAPILANARS